MKTLTEIALRSAVEGIAWPALPSPEARDLLSQLYQLERTEWLSPELLQARQLAQFGLLARHVLEQSDFYRERFGAAGIAPEGAWGDEQFRALPLLTRGDLSTRAEAIAAKSVPKSHGPISVVQTSGSTGQVVAVKRTALCQLIWMALTVRDHLWHRRDFGRVLAAVRANVPVQDDEEAARRFGWGPPVTLLCPTGPAYALPLSTPVAAQARWLLERDPGYLLTYPTNLAALLGELEAGGRKPKSLVEVRTIGETLAPELRRRCQESLGVRVVDNYSSQEVGIIALECPESGLYHVQSESLIVEVLDDAGRPCEPGQVGRVVVTDLHNFATPLIRYELRDRAELGPICPCGRGLPTLVRVLGRERNMVQLPNGERCWPLVGLHRYREVGRILQYQLIQHGLADIEMRLVTGGSPLDEAQEQRLAAIVQQALGHRFNIAFRYFDGELPHSQGGKFEEFLCLVPEASQS